MLYHLVSLVTKEIHVHDTLLTAHVARRHTCLNTSKGVIHTIIILDGETVEGTAPVWLIVDCHIVRMVSRLCLALLELRLTRMLHVTVLLERVLRLDEAKRPQHE